MKRLIKRYVLKAQVDRENDEVNEGKRLDQFPEGRREFGIVSQDYNYGVVSRAVLLSRGPGRLSLHARLDIGRTQFHASVRLRSLVPCWLSAGVVLCSNTEVTLQSACSTEPLTSEPAPGHHPLLMLPATPHVPSVITSL